MLPLTSVNELDVRRSVYEISVRIRVEYNTVAVLSPIHASEMAAYVRPGISW